MNEKTHRQIVHELLSDLVREDVHAKRVALRKRILLHLPIEDPDDVLAQTGDEIVVKDHKLVLADEKSQSSSFNFKMPKI